MSELDDTVSPDSDTDVTLHLDRLQAAFERRRASRTSEQAKLCRLNRTHYLDILSGRRTASLKTALKIASAAKTPVEKLWTTAA